jgi:hypothetical protein
MEIGLPNRNDQKFNYLCDIHLLKEMVGKFIALPNLGTMPKQMTNDKTSNFFLSKQSFERLKELFDTVRMDEDNVQSLHTGQQAGVIISGTRGIGTTSLGYLMACAGYINKCFVIYMVSSFVLLSSLTFLFSLLVNLGLKIQLQKVLNSS